MTPLDLMISYDLQHEILSCLTPTQLAVIALRWDGMTSIEVAHALGISEESVSMRLSHARRKLLQEIPELESMARDRSCKFRGGKRRLEGRTN